MSPEDQVYAIGIAMRHVGAARVVFAPSGQVLEMWLGKTLPQHQVEEEKSTAAPQGAQATAAQPRAVDLEAMLFASSAG